MINVHLATIVMLALSCVVVEAPPKKKPTDDMFARLGGEAWTWYEDDGKEVMEKHGISLIANPPSYLPICNTMDEMAKYLRQPNDEEIEKYKDFFEKYSVWILTESITVSTKEALKNPVSDFILVPEGLIIFCPRGSGWIDFLRFPPSYLK